MASEIPIFLKALFQDRIPLDFQAMTSDNSDEAFHTGTYLYGVRARYAFTYGHWVNAVRVLLTT